MDELEIRWLRIALSNLDDIATYIAQDNPPAAVRIVSRVVVLRVYHGARKWPGHF